MVAPITVKVGPLTRELKQQYCGSTLTFACKVRTPGFGSNKHLKLYMRDGDFTADQITLIAAGVSLQRGKLPDSVIDASDAWLVRASKKDRRALRALSRPQSKDKG